MKRILLFLTCALMLFGVARAEDKLVAQCLFGKSYNSASTQNYTTSWTATNKDYTWNIVNFNNNQNNWDFVKCGAKSNSTAYITTKNPIPDKITKVGVLIPAITVGNVTEITLEVSTTSDFNSVIETDILSKTANANAEQIVEISEPISNGYYRLTFVCTAASSNGVVQVNQVSYYTDGDDDNQGGEVTPPVDPTPGGESGSYTIVFANNNTANDGSIYNSSTINKAIETGGEYVSAITGYTNAYPGKSGFGLKLGTSGNTGDFTFSLSEKGRVHATKLVFSAAAYNTGDKASLKVTLNGSKVFTEPLSTSHTDLEDFVFTIEDGIDLETIKFESTVKRANIKSITVYYGDDNSDKTPVTLSYDENTYTATKGETFNAPKLNVTPEEAANAVSYKTDNANVATVDASGAVTVKELGKTTVKAEISDNETYADTSASYTLNVIKNGEYTVAEALTAIKNGYEGKAQVKGIIISIDEISEQFKNATYNISDDAAGTNSLQVYRGKWLEGADFNGNEIQVGGIIVVEGNLTNFNGTLEVGSGNVVISYIPPVIEAQDFTGFEKYEEDGIELEVGDEFTLDLGDKYPVITYNFDEEGIISITGNKVKALSEGIVEVTASWNADDNWKEGSAEFIVMVSAAQLGEIIATVSDGQKLENNGTITISEGTTITFTAKNANSIYLYSEIDEVEQDGSSLVWTPTLCEDEEVMVEATMDSEDTKASASFEFTLTVTEKQYEKGTEQNPYTVTELDENFSNISEKVWVTGYIVGSMVNSNPVFGQANNHANTNLVFSDDAETPSKSYIPVELPSGNVRTALNVKENADNIGRKVMLYGSAATYFSMNGLKSVTEYKFLDEETPDQTPALSFTFEGQTVTEPIELGWNATVFPTLVTPDDAEFDVTYKSSNTSVAEIDNEGNITLKGVAGETVITATTAAIEGQYSEGSVSYTLVILDPNSAKGMFNFTVENAYDMTSTDNGGTYQEGSITANEKDVTLVLNGRFRSWKNNKGSYDLRVYSTGTEAGSLTFSVPAGYKLETIEFNTDGTDYTKLSPEVGTIKNGVWEPNEDVVTSVKFTASGTTTIYTIDVYYTAYIELSPGKADDQQSGVFENGTYKIVSVQDVARVFFLNTPEGKVPYYRVEYDEIPDPGANEGDNGETEQLPSSKPAIRRANTEGWTAAKVYTYELNNGDYFGELNNESSGTIYVKYADEDGSNETKPVSYAFVVERNNPTGVESVVVGEGEVIYFDLNGRRVLNPDKGIFIKVEADKVSKVIL